MIDCTKLPDRINHVYLKDKPRLKGLILPMMEAYNQLLLEVQEWKDVMEADLSYNAQTWSIEKLLNTKYPLANGSIWIENISRISYNAYIGHSTKQRPLAIGHSTTNNALRMSHSQAGGSINFIVHVPASLEFDEDEMRSYIDRYKRYSKQYKIEIDA